MSRLSRWAAFHGLDLLVVVAAVESGLEVALRHGARAPTAPVWLSVPALALVILPLLGRRRFPFAAPVGVWVLAAGLSFVDGRLVPFTPSASVAGFAAAFLLGRVREVAQARLGLAVVIVAAAIIVYHDPAHAAGQLIFTPALFGIGWVAGFGLRVRGEQVELAEARAREAERERALAARIAAAEERARIARELHDIVAHAVSVMVLQVGGVRHHLPEAVSEDKQALQEVEQTGREALAEVRRLLGATRRTGDTPDRAPQPGLGSLGLLLEQLERTGLSVALRTEGEPVALPSAVELSAYRIVQEGLTNALKHGRASRADVLIRYGSDELEIEVRNDGTGAGSPPGPPEEQGFGLVGVQERVKVYGGEMSARRLSDGGFVLTTRLPLEDRRR